MCGESLFHWGDMLCSGDWGIKNFNLLRLHLAGITITFCMECMRATQLVCNKEQQLTVTKSEIDSSPTFKGTDRWKGRCRAWVVIIVQCCLDTIALMRFK